MSAALLLLALAGPQQCTVPALLQRGHRVQIEIVDKLTSRTHQKGNVVAMRVAENVVVGGRVAIAAGTPVTGQISDSADKGGMGASGMLTVRPLFLRTNGAVVRLMGDTPERGTLPAGSVIGMPFIVTLSGRSAVIEPGTPLIGMVEKEVTLQLPGDGC